MEQQLPEDVQRALDSDCATDLSEVISRRDEEDIAVLRRQLAPDASASREHRMKAMYALGRLEDSASVESILNLLPQLDARERVSAVDALGRLGTPEAANAVLQLVDDESQEVRMMVTRALRRLNTADAREALRRMAEADPDNAVRDAAARRASNGDSPAPR